MAKSKQTLNRKQKRNSNTPEIPTGFKVIGRAPNWDVEKNPIVQGVRGEAHEVIMDAGTKKERKVRTIILMDDELGPVTVWESGGLRDMFDQTEDGDTVRIEFLGLGEAKKGQNAPKLFSCAVKSEE